MNKVTKERIIFDNYDDDYEDDFGNDLMWDLYDEAIGELDLLFNNSVVAFGSVGRWNGIFKGGRIYKDIREAIYDITEDCPYIKIYDENGHLFVHCTHHDGSCSFELKAMTKDGEDYYDRWNYGYDNRTERECIEQIVKRYSKLPNAYHNIYGGKVREYVAPTKEVLQNRLYNEARSFYS